jgi:hypothetical protein
MTKSDSKNEAMPPGKLVAFLLCAVHGVFLLDESSERAGLDGIV